MAIALIRFHSPNCCASASMAGRPPSGEAHLLETNSIRRGRSRLVMAGINPRRRKTKIVQNSPSPKGETFPHPAKDWGTAWLVATIRHASENTLGLVRQRHLHRFFGPAHNQWTEFLDVR